MLKRALVLTVVLALALCLLPARDAQAAMLTTSSDLYKNQEGNLHFFVHFQWGSSPEITTFSVALLQYKNGAWTSYDSWAGVGSETVFSLTKTLSPPKGYYYQVKTTASCGSFPNLVFYSNQLYY